MDKIKIGDHEFNAQVGADGAEFTLGDSKVKLDKEGNLLQADAFGNRFEKVDGGTLITRANGTKMLIADDGGITLQTPPKSVGIKDLSQVASHTVRTEGELSVHTVTFNDGGHAELTFSAQGVLVGLGGHRLAHVTNNDNEMLIFQYQDPETL